MRLIPYAMPCLIGCLPGGPDEKLTALADINDLVVSVSATPDNILVRLQDSEIPEDRPDPCPVLATQFAARIGDIEVPLVDRGGWIGEFDSFNVCSMPRLQLDDPPREEGLVLELSDPSLAIRCPLGDALIPRTMTKVPDGPWEITSGERVTIRYSRANDLQPPGAFHVVFTTGGTTIPAAEVTHTDDLVTFTVPPLALGQWALELVVFPPGTACTGANGHVGGQQTVVHSAIVGAR